MWYNSAMTYDMVTAGPWNNMNLHMNQLYDHSAAWNNMFMYPQYNFGGFMPYGDGLGCNPFMTNPMYTIGQMSWGTPMWNNFSNMCNGNMGNMWGNMGWFGSPFGNMYGPTGTGTGTGNGSTTQNKKYNRLLNLCKQMANSDGILRDGQKDTLNDAIREANKKKTAEERYEHLLEAYNSIPKDLVRVFLVEKGTKLGVSKDVKNINDSDTFCNRLQAAGHEYTGMTIDKELDNIYDGIAELSDKNATNSDVEGIADKLKIGTHDILDLISSWNNEYKSTSGSERLIKHIQKYYNKLEDKDGRKTAKDKILKPFVNELIVKANSTKQALDSTSKKAIENAVDELRKELGKTDKAISNTLSEKFDKLYLLTRQAAMAEFRNDAKRTWGEIDSKVFNDELFEDEMIEDLESEGFSKSDIEKASVSVSERRARLASSSDDKDDNAGDDDNDDLKDTIDNYPAADQRDMLVKAGYLEQLTYKKDGTITVYQEKKKTGDSDDNGEADYARLFYINNDGKLVEWTNTKLKADGTGVEVVESGVEQTESIIKGSEIMAYKAETVKAEEEAEEDDNSADYSISESDAEDIVKSNDGGEDGLDVDSEAFENGENIAGALIGGSSHTNITDTNDLIMNKTNKTNIFVTLAGYEDDDACGDDIIAQIITEDNKRGMTNKLKQKWIKHIMNCAKANLEAQLIVEKKKKDKDTVTIEQLENDIEALKKHIKNGVTTESTADEVDKILANYIKEADSIHNTQCGFMDCVLEPIGNFFANTFDWG